MALTSKRPGAPIIASKGRKGMRPDLYAARIVDQPQMVTLPSGRIAEVATVIALQTNQEGEQYLAEFVHNLGFAFDRKERVIELDGPVTDPKSWQSLVAEASAATLAFLSTRPEAVTEMALDDIEA